RYGDVHGDETLAMGSAESGTASAAPAASPAPGPENAGKSTAGPPGTALTGRSGSALGPAWVPPPPGATGSGNAGTAPGADAPTPPAAPPPADGAVPPG